MPQAPIEARGTRTPVSGHTADAHVTGGSAEPAPHDRKRKETPAAAAAPPPLLATGVTDSAAGACCLLRPGGGDLAVRLRTHGCVVGGLAVLRRRVTLGRLGGVLGFRGRAGVTAPHGDRGARAGGG